MGETLLATPAEAKIQSIKPKSNKVKTACTDSDIESKPLLQRINWMHVLIVLVFPTYPIIGLFCGVSLQWQTMVLAFVTYFWYGWGITAGYHRLFSHRSYKASLPVQILLLIWGAGAMQGSARWWSRNHRAHHRYVDTEKDPYNANRGFWYSHMGWMLVKQNPDKIGRADIRDLNASKLVRFQHKFYVPIALLASFVFPCVVAGYFWGDWLGGLLYAGFARCSLLHQSTFCVNSLAHYLGNKTYNDEYTPVDSWITALVTLGEGYHNFHHSLPNDYRNAVRWYQYDPTKWFIWTLSCFGLVSDLKRFPENEVLKSRLQMKIQRIKEQISTLRHAPSDSELPVLTTAQIKDRVAKGECLIVVKGYVHDVANWLDDHPGGVELLQGQFGKDSTAAFNGAIYNHSRIARNLLDSLRIARVDPKTAL